MPTTYPVPVFHFQVEGAGARIGFTEVSGLNFTVEPIEYRDGNSPDYHVTKYSGMHKFGNITLKRGIFTGNNDLFLWLTSVNLSKPDRRTITIKLLDETHAPIVTYTVNNAWPTKFDGISFKSTGNETAIESVELVCESWLVSMS
ncbi:MAG TPA: phage tail protein [Bacteroidia bacterium]|jgi:phage tail-like protein|nr:phage tail protein [Bacteroidia bacterium]